MPATTSLEQPQPETWTGRPRRRIEDQRLITGQGLYAEDKQLPGTLSVVLLRSPYPHARIKAVDVEAARQAPGVVDVISGEDTAHLSYLTRNQLVPNARWVPYPPLATERVRYVGEGVAAALAETPYQARDAADLIEVDYEPLPAVATPEAAVAAGAPVLHEELGTNEAYEVSCGSSVEEVDQAFKAADHVVSLRIEHNRLAPVPLEPRSILASYDRSAGTLTVWVSTQRPFGIREDLAKSLELDPAKIRVIAQDVGGGFGSKSILYREYLLAAYLSVKHGRPVRWVGTRNEEFMVANHGRALVSWSEGAFSRDGQLLALRERILGEMGAYLNPNSTLTPVRVGRLAGGAYQVKVARAEIRAAFTNTGPTGPYRGAGRPEAAFIIERIMDTAARELDIDPIELRRRNFIRPDQFPWTTPCQQVYDSGNYARTLDRALELAGYEELLRERQQARARGELYGLGLSTFVEPSGGGFEAGLVRVEPNGQVVAATGSHSHGQGHATTFEQVMADFFQLPIEQVRLVENDTANTPEGVGTMGSRSAILGGSSLVRAGEAVLEKMKRIVGHRLEVDPADVVYEKGVFHPAGDPVHSLGFVEIAALAYDREKLPAGMEPGLQASERFQSAEAWSHGTHIAAVAVDRDSGEVTIRKLVAVDDAGVIINPLLAQGQLHGSLAQGIGQALFEKVTYDAGATPTSATLMDYAVARADQLPNIITGATESPSPLNPLGVKGLGEAGTVGVPAAIANAVIDALAGYGVKQLDMPFTREKVWRVIRGGRLSADVYSA